MRQLCFGENTFQITCQNKMSVSSVVFQAGNYNQEPYKLIFLPPFRCMHEFLTQDHSM